MQAASTLLGSLKAEGAAIGSASGLAGQPPNQQEAARVEAPTAPAEAPPTAMRISRLAPAPHPAAPTPKAAPEPETEAVEQIEEEGVALFRPATAETRRGRLATAVAVASPYTQAEGPPGRPGASAAAVPQAPAPQATALPEAPDVWRAAAERPVAAVGGTTGRTHVGGAAQLAAARLHAAPGAAAAVSARLQTPAPEPQLAVKEPGQERPLSPTDVRKGQSLAAADVAAGHKAAADAATATAGAGEAGGPAGWGEAAEKLQPPEQTSARQLPAQQEEQQVELTKALGVRYEPQQAQQRGAAVGPGGRTPPQALPPWPRATQPESEPLLPAGAFSQEQDISVFRWVGG